MSRGSIIRLVCLALVWGSGFFFIAIALRGFSAVQITFARFVLGGGVLIPLVILRQGRLPRGRQLWAHLLIAALLANVIPYTLFAYAQERIPSSVAGAINATTPLWTLLCEMAAGLRRPGVARSVGLLVGFAGTLLIFAPWGSGASVQMWASLAALVASACYGLAYVYQYRYLTSRRESPLALAAGQMTCAAAIMVVTIPVGGAQPIHVRTDAMFALFVLGTVVTGAAYVLNFRLIADEGPASSIVSYLIPLVAVLLGAFGLGEPLTPRILGGVVIVLLGVAVAQYQDRPTRQALDIPT